VEEIEGKEHDAVAVPAMSGERPDLAAIDDDQGAVAVMLDLGNPPVSGRRFQYERRDFWLDEAERGRR
jgi:hypothetical protein